MRLVLTLLALLLVASLAVGAPPPGVEQTDPQTGVWFRSLHQPGTGALCCGISDCRAVKARATDGHYEALIDRQSFGPEAPDDWVRVPDGAVLRDVVSWVDHPVACWSSFYYKGEPQPSGGLRCFIRSAEG